MVTVHSIRGVGFLKKILFYFMLTTLMGCSSYQEPHYVKYADAVINPYLHKICEEENLRVIGQGGGYMENVNLIIITLDSHELVDIDRGRKIFVKVISAVMEHKHHWQSILTRPFL